VVEVGRTVLVTRVLNQDSLRLVFIQIFAGNIVFRYLVRANFLLVSGLSALNTRYDVGLERIPFFDQLLDALRIRGF